MLDPFSPLVLMAPLGSKRYLPWIGLSLEEIVQTASPAEPSALPYLELAAGFVLVLAAPALLRLPTQILLQAFWKLPVQAIDFVSFLPCALWYQQPAGRLFQIQTTRQLIHRLALEESFLQCSEFSPRNLTQYPPQRGAVHQIQFLDQSQHLLMKH